GEQLLQQLHPRLPTRASLRAGRELRNVAPEASHQLVGRRIRHDQGAVHRLPADELVTDNCGDTRERVARRVGSSVPGDVGEPRVCRPEALGPSSAISGVFIRAGDGVTVLEINADLAEVRVLVVALSSAGTPAVARDDAVEGRV